MLQILAREGPSRLQSLDWRKRCFTSVLYTASVRQGEHRQFGSANRRLDRGHCLVRIDFLCLIVLQSYAIHRIFLSVELETLSSVPALDDGKGLAERIYKASFRRKQCQPQARASLSHTLRSHTNFLCNMVSTLA